MFDLNSAIIVLFGITFFAAFVSCALGCGFSSLTVPVALVFYTNRGYNYPGFRQFVCPFDKHQKAIRGIGAYVDNATSVMLAFTRPHPSKLMLIYSIGIDRCR